MTALSLARPIENVTSTDEAHVLAILDHLAPVLGEWRTGQDLREEAHRVEIELQAQRERFTTLRATTAILERQIKETEGPLNLFAVGALSFAGLGVIVAFLLHGLAILGILLCIAALGLGVYWYKRRSQARGLTAQRTQSDVQAAQVDSTISALAKRQATINDEMSRRPGGFPKVKLANVRFGLRVAEVAGRRVIIDESGSHADTVLRTIDVSALEDGVAGISAQVDALLNVPPMLAPDNASEAPDPIERLYGEENGLSNLVTEFTQYLGLLRNIELSLPLIPAESLLASRLATHDVSPVGGAPVLMVSEAASSQAEVLSFIDEVERSERDGKQVFDELQNVFQLLSNGCNLYAEARSKSVNTLHANLLDVLQRATWCNRRFYCARTIMSQTYLEDLIGSPLDQAYRLSQNDLLDHLRSDDAIRRRLEVKPELEGQLRDAHLRVQEFIGADLTDRQPAPVRNRYIEEQLRECIRGFTRTLQKVMTGSSFPLLNVSAEAVLYYDPDSEEWSSGLTPYVYRTHEVLRYGSVVKAYADLMIPLWEHLWTEKADFRRAETFRTNEQLIQMSEKEAEKLIDVANQFRSDMRSIRENMNVLGAELKSKVSEIEHFRDGMDSLGLLSQRTRDAITLSGDDLKLEDNEAVAQAERFETILAAQPQTQMESRGTVQDPIDLVRGVDALLPHRGVPAQRLLAA